MAGRVGEFGIGDHVGKMLETVGRAFLDHLHHRLGSLLAVGKDDLRGRAKARGLVTGQGVCKVRTRFRVA